MRNKFLHFLSKFGTRKLQGIARSYEDVPRLYKMAEMLDFPRFSELFIQAPTRFEAIDKQKVNFTLPS